MSERPDGFDATLHDADISDLGRDIADPHEGVSLGGAFPPSPGSEDPGFDNVPEKEGAW